GCCDRRRAPRPRAPARARSGSPRSRRRPPSAEPRAQACGRPFRSRRLAPRRTRRPPGGRSRRRRSPAARALRAIIVARPGEGQGAIAKPDGRLTLCPPVQGLTDMAVGTATETVVRRLVGERPSPQRALLHFVY